MPVKLGIAFPIAASASLVEAQVFQTLGSFNSLHGEWPYVAPTLGNDGNLYDTTQDGGSGHWGTVLRVTTSGTLTNLVSFNAGGSRPGR